MTFLKKAISILISCFFIYLCLKDIPLKNLFDKIDYNINLLLSALFLLFLINIVKSLRLKILLRNYKKKKFHFYFRPIILRQFFNTAFFLNAGEVITPLILRKYFKCSYFEGLSILFSERLIDLTVITLIFGVTLFFNNFDLDNKIIYGYFLIYFSLVAFFLFIINYKKKIFFISNSVIQNFILGYKFSIRNKDILWISFFLSFTIWLIFILIDLMIFRAFEITNPISTIPNIIFLTAVMVFSQFIPAAPASVGIFNYFVIQTIEFFYKVQGINYDLTTQIQLTSISVIVLLIYIIPDITLGSYVFYKESLQGLKKFKINR